MNVGLKDYVPCIVDASIMFSDIHSISVNRCIEEVKRCE